jgi:hypothetical protein
MKKKKVVPEEELDPVAVRNKLVDELIGSSFQLSATGTIFTIGSENSDPGWEDILFVLNRLYTTGYAEEFKLLPFNVEPVILVSGLTKEVVNWLVPLIIQAVDRKVLSGSIDILSPNNKNLVRLADVLGWYWYKRLHGPKPVINSMIKMQRPIKVVQDAALCCPMCYTQFRPTKSLTTQSAKAWAYARWFPKHLVEYHQWHEPRTRKNSVTKKGGTHS